METHRSQQGARASKQNDCRVCEERKMQLGLSKISMLSLAPYLRDQSAGRGAEDGRGSGSPMLPSFTALVREASHEAEGPAAECPGDIIMEDMTHSGMETQDRSSTSNGFRNAKTSDPCDLPDRNANAHFSVLKTTTHRAELGMQGPEKGPSSPQLDKQHLQDNDATLQDDNATGDTNMQIRLPQIVKSPASMVIHKGEASVAETASRSATYNSTKTTGNAQGQTIATTPKASEAISLETSELRPDALKSRDLASEPRTSPMKRRTFSGHVTSTTKVASKPRSRRQEKKSYRKSKGKTSRPTYGYEVLENGVILLLDDEEEEHVEPKLEDDVDLTMTGDHAIPVSDNREDHRVKLESAGDADVTLTEDKAMETDNDDTEIDDADNTSSDDDGSEEETSDDGEEDPVKLESAGAAAATLKEDKAMETDNDDTEIDDAGNTSSDDDGSDEETSDDGEEDPVKLESAGAAAATWKEDNAMETDNDDTEIDDAGNTSSGDDESDEEMICHRTSPAGYVSWADPKFERQNQSEVENLFARVQSLWLRLFSLKSMQAHMSVHDFHKVFSNVVKQYHAEESLTETDWDTLHKEWAKFEGNIELKVKRMSEEQRKVKQRKTSEMIQKGRKKESMGDEERKVKKITRLIQHLHNIGTIQTIIDSCGITEGDKNDKSYKPGRHLRTSRKRIQSHWGTN